MQIKSSKLISNLLKDFHQNHWNSFRLTSSKPNYVATIQSDISTQFDIGLRYRLHAGRRHIPTVFLPSRLESAALYLINKYNCHQFKEDVNQMFRRVIDHQLPPEPQEVKLKAHEIKQRIALKDQIDLKSLTEEEKKDVFEERNRKLERSLKDSLLNHQPIEFDEYLSIAYMTARMPANYAALYSIFKGIEKDVPGFRPRTLFDFGSGVGTTIWAAEEVWPKYFDEYFCVDISKEMNDISRLLLSTIFTGFSYLVSAFSLLDIPDAKNRVHVIENLWHKTQDLLVIVEHGSRAGFAAVLEARNLILQLSGHKITADIKPNIESTQPSTEYNTTDATIVSPCSHDMTCPRQLSKGPLLCNFEVPHNPLRYGQQNAIIRKERFSYIVIQKGNRQTAETKKWPRIVQPVLTGHHRAICRLCCSDGQLKEVFITKSKHETHSYRCAKISRWGDKFPANIEPLSHKND